MRVRPATGVLLAALLVPLASWAERPVIVGSKAFPESYLLAEVMAQKLERAGVAVERRIGLGSTMICYEALRQGEIDVYPEYTGTVGQAILQMESVPGLEALRARLMTQKIDLLAPLGFNNTYAIAVREALAVERGLRDIGDLAAHDDLRVAFSHEFLERADGWPGLAARYQLPFTPAGIEHGLAYQALAEERIDVTDAYSTDGEIPRYGLRLLKDRSRYFPSYLAVPIARADLPAPARAALLELAGSIDEGEMQSMNAESAAAGGAFARTAKAFLERQTRTGAAAPDLTPESAPADELLDALWRNTLTHLQLTGIALGAAIAVGVPVGVLVFRSRSGSRAVLYVAGLLQTIPSIALLALMIPFFGIGVLPAVVALFLYSLLPIVRSTITALLTTDPVLRRVAVAMGLSGWQQLRYVLLPLALPNVLTGIKTAAVISIGTATLAAFIGAGGLGQPIVTGLALNDPELILQGALPAAGLAMLTELAFEVLERRLVPAHLLANRVAD